MIGGPGTVITRDWPKTLANAAGCSVVIAVVWWALWRPIGVTRPMMLVWPASIVLWAVALFFAYRALFRCGVARCPGCGYPVTGLATGGNRGVACLFCGKYLEGIGGRLQLTAADELAPAPIFETLVPREIKWPAGCCVCRAPATRNVTLTVKLKDEAPLAPDLAVRIASIGTLKLVGVRTLGVDVPHCDQHGDGAEIAYASDTVTELAIRFRSHAYFAAFCEENGALPRT
jgi:hypothetical protein